MTRTVRAAAALLITTLCACVAQPPLQNVSLQWKPSADASLGVVQASGRKFSFDTFKDVRQQPELIAENREKATPRQVTTKDDVGAFVATHMRQIFAQGGLATVDNGGDVVVSGEVRQFFVEETESYKANVILHLTVRDTAGRVLWEGDVSGASSTFGRSYSMENYDQVLSDSVIDASATLIKDRDFRSAVMKE
jgi:ApbE superfamily uncharacterized protein (UPF0280 family)